MRSKKLVSWCFCFSFFNVKLILPQLIDKCHVNYFSDCQHSATKWKTYNLYAAIHWFCNCYRESFVIFSILYVVRMDCLVPRSRMLLCTPCSSSPPSRWSTMSEVVTSQILSAWLFPKFGCFFAHKSAWKKYSLLCLRWCQVRRAWFCMSQGRA
jgi:hypothetical protein